MQLLKNLPRSTKIVAKLCSKIESNLFCCRVLQQFFLSILLHCTKILHGSTVQFFQAHAMQHVALHAHGKIAPWSPSFRHVILLFSLFHFTFLFSLNFYFSCKSKNSVHIIIYLGLLFFLFLILFYFIFYFYSLVLGL